MPDISMCGNKECPSKDICYRFSAVPNPHRQSYMGYKPKKGEDKCDSFYKIRKGHQIIIKV